MNLQQKYGLYLLKSLPIFNFTFNKKELSLNIPLMKLIQIFFFLKYHTHSQYKILSDICVVDYLNRIKRFEMVYHLLSIRFNTRLRIQVSINELDSIPSLFSLYSSASWYEREIWDMFGIFFLNHPDLRRILTDYGFEGYPLRKDFPLSGYLEVYYDETKKRVVYNSLTLSQKYRSFNFQSPWNI